MTTTTDIAKLNGMTETEYSNQVIGNAIDVLIEIGGGDDMIAKRGDYALKLIKLEESEK
jgi:hypothetical protein